MSLFQRSKVLLRKPFPQGEGWTDSLKIIAVVSGFVVFTLYVFQPFGISRLTAHTFWICLGFGATTFLATAAYEFIIDVVLRLKRPAHTWTFARWIINNLGILLVISLSNFLFARLLLFGYVDWSLFPAMLYGTLMIGIVPLLVLGGWALMWAEQKHMHIADTINKNMPQTENTSLPEDALFGIPLDRFRYAEALQNYVRIGYIDQRGLYTTRTERTTLKNILQQVKGSPVVRSHRSFLVNRQSIIGAEGNAQGLRLSLADCDVVVPVSRSHVHRFKIT